MLFASKNEAYSSWTCTSTLEVLEGKVGSGASQEQTRVDRAY